MADFDIPDDSDLVPLDEAAPPDEDLEPIADDAQETAEPVAQPWKDAIDDESKRVRIRAALEATRGLTGQDAADVLSISKALGVPTSTVAGNVQAWRRSAESSAFDPDVWAAQNPLLASAVLESPYLAPLVMREKALGPLVRAWHKAIDWLQDLGRVDAAEAPVEGYGINVPPQADIEASVGDFQAAAMAQGEAKVQAQDARDAEGAALRSKRDAPRAVAEVADAKAAVLADDPSVIAKGIVVYARALESSQQLDIARLQFQQMLADVGLGGDPVAVAAKLHDAKLNARPRAYGDDSGLARDLAVAIQGATSTVQVAEQAIEGAVEAGGAAAVGGAALGAIGGAFVTRSPAGAASWASQGAAMGARWAAPKGAAAKAAWATFALEAGSTYGELRELRTDAGAELSAEEAFGGAVLAGAIKTGLELVSLGQQSKVVTGPLAARVTGLLKTDPTFRALAGRLAREWAKSVATEGLTEGAQNAVDQLARYVSASAKDSAPQSWPALDVEAVLADVEAGAMGAALLGTATSAVAIGITRTADSRAEVADRQLPALAAMAADKAVQSAPVEFAKVVAEATAESGRKVDAVHVDAGAVLRLYQQRGGTEAAVAEVERLVGPGAGEKLVAAAAAGGRLEVPMESFLGRWGASETGKALLEDTSTDPALATPRQRREEAAELESEAQRLADEAQAATKADAHVESFVAQLVEAGQPKKQAQAAGVILRAYMETQAKDFDTSVAELFPESPVVVAKGDEAPAPPTNGDEIPALAPQELASEAPSTEGWPHEDPQQGAQDFASAQDLAQDSAPAQDIAPAVAAEAMAADDGGGTEGGGGDLFLERVRAGVAELQSLGFNPQEALDEARAAVERFREGKGGPVALELRRAAALAFLDYAEGKGPGLASAGSVGRQPGTLVVDPVLRRDVELWARRLGVLDPVHGLDEIHAMMHGGIDADMRRASDYQQAITTADRARKRDQREQFAKNVQGRVFQAQPTSRVVITPEASENLRSTLGGDAEAVRLATALEAPYLDGFSVESESFHVDRMTRPGAVTLKSHIFAGGKQVGYINREFAREGGRLVAHHELLSLSESHQGGGFGTELLLRTLDEYERLGVKEIRLFAALEAGPYVWARVGFDWGSLDAREETLSEWNEYLRRRGAESDIGNAKTPRDIALHRLGKDFWLGEEVQVPRVPGPADQAPEVVRGPAFGSPWQAKLEIGQGPHYASVREYLETKYERRLRRKGLPQAQGEAGGARSAEAGPHPSGPGAAGEQPGGAGRVGAGAETQGVDAEGRRLPQGEVGIPKGYTSIPEVSAARRVVRVFLNKSADVSTVLHETAHAFLELQRELSERQDAPARAKATMAWIRSWLGADEGKAFTRDQHERFARTFEAYVMEGKAPSGPVARAFTRLKLWMMDIYRAVRGVPGADLNPDSRRIFDALLATEDQVKAMRRRQGPQQAQQAPTPEARAEAWHTRLRDERESYDEGSRRVQVQAIKDELRAHESWWKEARAALVARFEEEYESLPGRKAQVAIEEAGLTLLRSEVERIAGRAKLPVKVGADGVRPQRVAELVGLPSAEVLVSALAGLRPKARWAAEQADAEMRRLHPGILDDMTRMRRELADGLAAVTERRLLDEWADLKRQSPVLGFAPVDALKRAAALVVARRQAGKLRPSQALAQERQAASRKARAAAKGEWDKAAVAAREELLSAFIYTEATKAESEVEKLEAMARRLARKPARERLGKASPVYRDAVDFLLGAAGLGPVRDGLDAGALDAAVEQARGDGVLVYDSGVEGSERRPDAGGCVPDWLEPLRRAVASGEPLESWTMDDVRHLRDALKHLQAGAHVRNTILVGDARVDYETTKADILQDIASVRPLLPPLVSAHARTPWQKLRHLVSSVDGFLVSPVDLVRDLVGDDQSSTLWRAVVLPMRRASILEADMMRSTLAPVLKAFESLPKSVKESWHDKVDGRALFPQHIESFLPARRYELLMLALNSGSESSLRVLLEGRAITREQLEAALNLLTEEEVAWCNTVLKAVESLREPSFSIEERLTGLRPQAVEALPWQLAGGRLEGGYFPLVAVKYGSRVGTRQAARDAASFLDATFTRPGTAHGHLKSRTGATYPVELDPQAIIQHMAKSVHDIAFRDVVLSLGRLFLDGDFTQALYRRIGEAKADEFQKWLEDVGGASAGASPNFMSKMTRFLKANMASALLSGFSTAIGNLANLPAAVASTKLKSKHLAAAVVELARDPMNERAAALAQSGILRQMDDTLAQDFERSVGSIGKGAAGRALDASKDVGTFLMRSIDKAVATSVWVGAHRQAIAEGKTQAEAVRWADDLVLQVQPSAAISEKAGILRHQVWGLFVMFYGYLSVAYRAGHRLASPLFTQEFEESAPADKAKAGLKVAASLFAFYVVLGPMSELLMGRGPEAGDEDDEEPDNESLKWANWFRRKLFVSPLSTLPMPLAQAVESLWTGKPMMVRPDPIANATAQIVGKLGKEAIKAMDGGGEPEKVAIEALRSAGLLLGIPSRLLETSVRYAAGLATGAKEPQSFGEAASGLVYGERDNQPANPFNMLGPSD